MGGKSGGGGGGTVQVKQPKLSDFIPAFSNLGGITVSFGPMPSTGTGSGSGSGSGGGGGGGFSGLTTFVGPQRENIQVPIVSNPFFVGSNAGSFSGGDGGGGGGGGGDGDRRRGGRDQFIVGSTPERQALVNQIAASIGAQAAGLQSFINQVNPGFGALTEAGVQAIRTARERTVSDLRGGLQQRRLSGSSFANDAITRAENEFGQAEAQFRSEAFLKEFDTQLQLFNQKSALETAAIDTHLIELDKQAEVGTSILRGIVAEFGASSRAAQQTAAQLAASNAQGSGSFVGSLLGIGASLIAPNILSSERLKNDISDAPDVLDAVKTMPVKAWRYKPGLIDDTYRIGPMAHEFNSRFREYDDGTIDIATALGVLFKAVQELTAKVEALDGTE